MYSGAETRIHNDTLREEVYLRHHESGLPVYFCPKPGFQKRYACFATHYGSIDSAFRKAGAAALEVPDGIAHFLEHKVFEREESNALELFSKRGASCNAYTSYSVTNYLFSCSDRFFENLDLLIEFVLTPHITEENVEKEKGIIGQEIKMYDDHAGWRSFTSLLTALYQNHPVRKDIAGTTETIAGIDRDVLYTCHRSFYRPGNMVLFGIGDEDREEFFARVDDRLAQFPDWDDSSEVERIYPEEPETVATENVTSVMEVSMPRLLVGIKDKTQSLEGSEFLAQELVTDILLELTFGRSSGFYQTLYEKKLIDDGFSASYSAYGDVAFSLIGGDTPDPEALTAEVRSEIERVRRDGFSEADFERQKRAAMGSFVRYFNSLEFTANNFCSYRFHGVNLFDIIDILHKVTFEDLKRRLDEHYRTDRMATSIVMPRAAEVV